MTLVVKFAVDDLQSPKLLYANRGQAGANKPESGVPIQPLACHQVQ